MGKLLRLKDGTEYTATVASTITNIQISVANYAAVDAIKAKLTAENLSEVVFDGRTYEGLTLADDSAHKSGGTIMAEFAMDLGIDDRIDVAIQAAIDAYTLQLIEEGLL